MRFYDRRDAGQRLGEALRGRGLDGAIVLGIPRGGVPVAAEVARILQGRLGVVVARKLGAPGYPELAIGATTANGVSYVNEALAAETGADARYLAAEQERQANEARRREDAFDSHRRPRVSEEIVVVVDDGVATGATAIAAIRSMKAAGAARVVLALPVGPPSTLEQLRREADEVVCLSDDPNFWAVGQYYQDFSPVEDSEVKSVLDSFERESVPDRQSVSIPRDGVKLSARVSLPEGNGPFPCVIFVHGLGSGKDSPRNVVISEHLVEARIATILFDLSGHGESSPDPRDGEDAYVDDADAVLRWSSCQPEFDHTRLGIAGSSLGAVVALRVSAEGSVAVTTMVLRAPPVEADGFSGIGSPALVIIGSLDPLLTAVRAAAARSPDVTLAVVEGAGHLFEEPGTLEEALGHTVDWFKSRLGVGVAVVAHSRERP